VEEEVGVFDALSGDGMALSELFEGFGVSGGSGRMTKCSGSLTTYRAFFRFATTLKFSL
jgi:hypothetical protein